MSDHFNGILSGPVGFLEGARIFEKHVTLNRAWKGSDHAFALEPEGYSKFVRDTTRVNQMLFGGDEALLGSEEIFARLGKSVVAAENITAGSVVGIEDLGGMIFLDGGIPVRDSSKIIGKIAKIDIKKRSKIKWGHLL